MKKIWRWFFRFGHALNRMLGFWRCTPAAMRLARLRAFRRDGGTAYVVHIDPLDGDAVLVRVAASGFDRKVLLYASDYRAVIYGTMRLQYHAAPAVAMAAFFGRVEYLSRPETYLTVVRG